MSEKIISQMIGIYVRKDYIPKDRDLYPKKYIPNSLQNISQIVGKYIRKVYIRKNYIRNRWKIISEKIISEKLGNYIRKQMAPVPARTRTSIHKRLHVQFHPYRTPTRTSMGGPVLYSYSTSTGSRYCTVLGPRTGGRALTLSVSHLHADGDEPDEPEHRTVRYCSVQYTVVWYGYGCYSYSYRYVL